MGANEALSAYYTAVEQIDEVRQEVFPAVLPCWCSGVVFQLSMLRG